MVLVDVVAGKHKFKLDSNLKSNLDGIKDKVRENWDFVIAVDGLEGCQPAGDKVLMSDGVWKNVEEIAVGDVVLSPQHNGSYLFSKVIATTSWFSEKNYDVITLNRKRKKLYSCSSNHLIPINSRVVHRTPEGRSTKIDSEWVIKDYQADYYDTLTHFTRQNQTSPSAFPIQHFKDRDDCEIEPYSLGAMLGDGCMVSGNFNITSQDKEIIDEISKHYKIIRVARKDKHHRVQTYHFSKLGKLAQQFKKRGLFNKKSGTKFIPKDALYSSYDYRMKLLAGLIDTDGTISKKSQGYSITTKSDQLAEDIEFLIGTLGGRSSKTRITKGIKSTGFIGEYNHLSFYLGNVVIPLKLSYKKKTNGQFYLSPNRYSIDLRKRGPEVVYGFTLDSPSGWYVTDNFMVTHNSGKSTLTAQAAAYLSPDITVDDCCFETEEFKERVIGAEKYQSVIFDESITGMFSRKVMHDVNKTMVEMFAQMRQKNLFVFVVIPSIFDMDAYFSKHRSRFLLHVDAPKYQRGNFYFYSRHSKMKLLYESRKYMYNWAAADFQGRFTDFMPFGKEYEVKKFDALKRLGEEAGQPGEQKERGYKVSSEDAIFNMVTNYGIQKRDVIDIFQDKFTMRQVDNILKKTKNWGWELAN